MFVLKKINKTDAFLALKIPKEKGTVISKCIVHGTCMLLIESQIEVQKKNCKSLIDVFTLVNAMGEYNVFSHCFLEISD